MCGHTVFGNREIPALELHCLTGAAPVVAIAPVYIYSGCLGTCLHTSLRRAGSLCFCRSPGSRAAAASTARQARAVARVEA